MFNTVALSTQLVQFDIFVALLRHWGKKVAENNKIRFQVFEISNSFLKCVGNSSNPHGIYTNSRFWTEEVVTVGLAHNY